MCVVPEQERSSRPYQRMSRFNDNAPRSGHNDLVLILGHEGSVKSLVSFGLIIKAINT